ncbi:peptide ABC transporter substrate-binding protein [Roseibacillus ishigakijimensis]|uniref:Peptide ABC transporter substrate-binding protein n=1 Tax=Roseibacillus ishigakijimensis TaxID=454146 RepID=A0A934RQR1_9BACT|nr:peptide ABC transporter substrate-binding protein [Roseibacillus ishigakijimensis]MBK1832806.1 peptide ABC transporter substrate-binding protein [Roseibacillus ishigakijimensis]
MARFLAFLPFLLFLTSCDPQSDVAQANEEKILIVGNSNEPKGLDPHLVSGVLESNIIRALFEGLCVEHPSQDGQALPGAATRWEASDDFTRWIFHLQPEGTWSDGVPVTAHDFVFSYRRLLSPDPNWPAKYAEMLYFLENAETYSKNRRGEILFSHDESFPTSWETLAQVNFGGDATIDQGPAAGIPFDKLSSDEKAKRLAASGLDKLTPEELDYLIAHPAAFAWPEEVPPEVRTLVLTRLREHHGQDLWPLARVGATALDDYTLEIRLRGPVPFLPEITKHYTWYPVPRHIILKHGEINTAFSSPWTKEENLVSNGPFQLKTWRTNHLIEVERNPHYWDSEQVQLNGIRYLPISNYYTESRMFGDEQLHVTYTVPSELIPYAQEKYPRELRQEPYVGVRFLRSNIRRKPFDNPKVRRAFALAIDQKAICEKILQGGQTPASGIVPPFGDYEPPGLISFDAEKARALLAESGYAATSSFPDITILTTDSDSGRREAEALQAMWKKHLGINVRIVQREWTTYLQKQYDGDFDLCVGGWIGDYLDPTTFLEMWIKDGGNNNTGWSSPEFESLLHQAENTAEVPARMATLAQAERVMMEETPVLPIYWYTTNYLIRPEVKNWHPLLLNNHPFKFVRLEP